MTASPDRRVRVAISAALVWLALFAILYTAGDIVGAWPKLPPGAFYDWDLYFGLAAGILLFASLPIRRVRAGS